MDKAVILLLFCLTVTFIVPETIPRNHVACYQDILSPYLPTVAAGTLRLLQLLNMVLVDACFLAMIVY